MATMTIPQTVIQPGNTSFPASDATAPAVQGGETQAELILNLLKADYEDAAVHLVIQVLQRPDTSSPWVNSASFPFDGGARVGKLGNPDPPIDLRTSLPPAGWLVKAAVTNNSGRALTVSSGTLTVS